MTHTGGGRTFQEMLSRLRRKISYLRTPRDRLSIKHTSINGYEMVIPVNEDVGRQIYYLGRYEESETAYIVRSLRPDDVCLDIGANVGYYTLLMARRVTGGIVHAFEPEPLNHALLSVNVGINSLGNVVVNKIAVGRDVGEATLTIAADRAFCSLRQTGRQMVRDVVRVPVTTLDAYVMTHEIAKVDVVKVDVEGAEGDVVDGAQGLLEDPSRRPRLLMLELYSANHKVFGEDIDGIVRRLKDRRYEPFVIENGQTMPFGEQHYDRFYNVFFRLSA